MPACPPDWGGVALMEAKKSYLRINPSPPPLRTQRMDCVQAIECTPPTPVDMEADVSGVIAPIPSSANSPPLSAIVILDRMNNTSASSGEQIETINQQLSSAERSLVLKKQQQELLDSLRNYRPTQKEREAMAKASSRAMAGALYGGFGLGFSTYFIARRLVERVSVRNSLTVAAATAGFLLGGSYAAAKASDELLSIKDSPLAQKYRKLLQLRSEMGSTNKSSRIFSNAAEDDESPENTVDATSASPGGNASDQTVTQTAWDRIRRESLGQGGHPRTRWDKIRQQPSAAVTNNADTGDQADDDPFDVSRQQSLVDNSMNNTDSFDSTTPSSSATGGGRETQPQPRRNKWGDIIE